jgi:hypothetical protein
MALASGVIALVSGLLRGGSGIILALALALAAADFMLGGLIALTLVIVTTLLRSRRSPDDLAKVLLVGAAIFLIMSIIRAYPLIDVDTSTQPAAQPNSVYLVLLDAYPRPDTLRKVGIDVSGFIHSM